MFAHRGYASLSKQFQISVPTVQKYLDGAHSRSITSVPAPSHGTRPVVVIIDTVYLSGRAFGVMIARDATERKTIDRMYVTCETIEHFVTLVERVRNRGITIAALVVDGRPGMLKAYPEIPTQMCQFHQIQICNPIHYSSA